MSTAAAEPIVSTTVRRRLTRPRIRAEHRVEVAFGVVVVLATTLFSFAVGNIYWEQVMLLMDLYIATAVFLNILRGEAGQISFGQAAVFGAAAYGVGMASGIYALSFWLSMLIGLAAGLAFALVTALPSLRVQGYYLGFVTLAAAVVFPAVLLTYNSFTHAVSGIPVIAPGLDTTTFWGLNWLAIAIMLTAALSFVVHAWIRASAFGRRLKVSAASPEAAASLGMRPGLLRLAAFGVAGVGSALCGVLYVPLEGFVSPGAFPFTLSTLLYFAVVVGGQGSIAGPLLGIYLLYLVPNVLLTDLAQYRLLIYGATAFLVMLIFPDGLIGFVRSRLHGRTRSHGELTDDLVAALLSTEVSTRKRPERSEGPPALQVKGISRSFGSVRALDDVSLTVMPGEVHGLVGANGSGKTTLLNAISGLIVPDAGQIVIGGRDMTRHSTRQRFGAGLGRTFQAPRVFEDMSLLENIYLGSQHNIGLPEELRRAWDRRSAQTLSHGPRRLVEVYRVLTHRPALVLFDEPAAGLSASERDQLGQIIRELAAAGVAVLLVEHDLGLVWSVASRLTVMDVGTVARQGTPDELADDDALAELLGGGLAHR